MGQIKIYIDEDAMDADLVTALRSRGVEVITALEVGMSEKSDEDHLILAAERAWVIYTFNVSDFYRLHTAWVRDGRDHAGMILPPQQRFSVGEQLRCVLRLRASVTGESMRNRVEFLGNWG